MSQQIAEQLGNMTQANPWQIIAITSAVERQMKALPKAAINDITIKGLVVEELSRNEIPMRPPISPSSASSLLRPQTYSRLMIKDVANSEHKDD